MGQSDRRRQDLVGVVLGVLMTAVLIVAINALFIVVGGN